MLISLVDKHADFSRLGLGVAWWQSVCLVYVRSWLPSLVLQNTKKDRRREVSCFRWGRLSGRGTVAGFNSLSYPQLGADYIIPSGGKMLLSCRQGAYLLSGCFVSLRFLMLFTSRAPFYPRPITRPLSVSSGPL